VSGHNKWSKVKHKKGAKDQKIGKIFSKIAKMIVIAAKEGGDDPDSNAKLRLAIGKAKQASMPNENIKRAIQKAVGSGDGEEYFELSYEGYGPEGVAVIVQCLTDNKNRTAAQIRHLFSKFGGNLGENGCVAWMFDKKGYISIEKSLIDEEKLMEIALENGAEDIKTDETSYEIITDPSDFETVRQALEDKEIEMEESDITMIPQTYIKLDEHGAKKVLRLISHLEDDDDVQDVYANFDIDDDIMEMIEE